MSFSQVPHSILMVRPAAFGFNPETAESNTFQKQSFNKEEVQESALLEFNQVIATLTDKKISTLVVDDTLSPLTTDAIFPNNWITTHEDGKIILYPMMAPSRRLERRDDIVSLLQNKFKVDRVIDLTEKEIQHHFLEGTGSIIFDHPNRIGYACRSDRTHESTFKDLCRDLNYKGILFDAVDETGFPVYHTNVMMWVGESMVGICLDSVKDEGQQELLLTQFRETNHKIIALSHQQMNSFAGNMFEVMNENGEHFLLMSQTAFESLHEGQVREMEKRLTLLPVRISTIEESGGGSIRCMVAGIHLPSK